MKEASLTEHKVAKGEVERTGTVVLSWNECVE